LCIYRRILMQFLLYYFSFISTFFIDKSLNTLYFYFKYSLLMRLSDEYLYLGSFLRQPSIIYLNYLGQDSGKGV